jgi:hypothetical protein
MRKKKTTSLEIILLLIGKESRKATSQMVNHGNEVVGAQLPAY